jgi:hypothetical protein
MNRSLKIGVLLFFACVLSVGMLHAQSLAERDSVKTDERN